MKTGLKMYDSCAIAYLLDPGMYQMEETTVDVELSGSMTAGCTWWISRDISENPTTQRSAWISIRTASAPGF